MCLDAEGNVVACAGSEGLGPGPMAYVFSPEGRVLETHPLPTEATNCAFGDPDLQTFYVTTESGYLYRSRNAGRQGWVPFPQGRTEG